MNCVHRPWFLDVFLSPCSDLFFHDRTWCLFFFNAVLSCGPKILDVQFWFFLACRDISYSWNLLIILCTVVDGIQETFFWNYSKICRQVFADLWTSVHLYFSYFASLFVPKYVIVAIHPNWFQKVPPAVSCDFKWLCDFKWHCSCSSYLKTSCCHQILDNLKFFMKL